MDRNKENSYQLVRQCSRLDVPLFQALHSYLDEFSNDAKMPLSYATFPEMMGAAVGLHGKSNIPPGDAFLLLLATKSVHSVLDDAEYPVKTDAEVERILRLVDRFMRRAALPQLVDGNLTSSLGRIITAWFVIINRYEAQLRSLDPRVGMELQRRAANRNNEQMFRRDPQMNDHVSTGAEFMTGRELEVLQFLCKGFTIKEIALLLGIKWFTVNDHMKSIYKKLEVGSRAEAAVAAVKRGLI